MIIGIGNDTVDIMRMGRLMARYGDRALQRIFTPEEQNYALRIAAQNVRMGALAKRFAAKEACAKALGSGFSQGIYWRDIGVVNDESGRPFLKLTGGAEARLKTLTPEGQQARVHLSLSDEFPFAQAFVVIESI